MTTDMKIDSEEKFLEVYGDVEFSHTRMTWEMVRDPKRGLVMQERISIHHKPEHTLLYKYGFISEQNFWKWREHFRMYHFEDTSRGYKRIYLNTLSSELDKDDSALDTMFPDLFVHVSKDKDGMIAFTPNEQMGRQDRQLKMKFGKFFRRYYDGDLTDQQLKTIANEFQGRYGNHQLQFAKGPEIADIYSWTHVGFNSCMMADDHEFESEVLPVSAYDSPDIMLAYLGDKDSRMLHARALINVPKKQYSVVYGNEQLSSILQDNGYEYGNLEGCRMKKIIEGNYYVVPYIDGECRFTEHEDDWLMITRTGEFSADTTEGVIYMRGRNYCDYHDEYTTEETEPVDGYGHVCEECLDNYFVRGETRSEYSAWIHEDSAIEINGEYYHQDCDGHEIIYSNYYETWLKMDDAVYSETIDSYIPSDSAMRVELISVDDEDWVPEDYEIDTECMRVA